MGSGRRRSPGRRQALLVLTRITRKTLTETSGTDWNGVVMIVLGIILLVLGYVLPVPLLITVGWILVVIGAVFWILGAVGRPVAGRRYWF